MIETRVDYNLERSGRHLGIKWKFRKFSPNALRNSDVSYYIRMEGFAKEFLRNFSSYDFELIFRRE